jgi:hypothetical protein
MFGLAVRRMNFCQLAIRPPHFDTDRRKAALGGCNMTLGEYERQVLPFNLHVEMVPEEAPANRCQTR